MFTLTILGPVPSKKNNYRISKNGGFFKPKKITDFEKMVGQEIAAQRIGVVRGKCSVNLELYFGKSEPDIDGAYTTILDCLQLHQVIENDRDVVAGTLAKYPVTGTARAVVVIREIL